MERRREGGGGGGGVVGLDQRTTHRGSGTTRLRSFLAMQYLRFLLCDVTLSPEEATAASSQDPNILYRRMAYLEANALGQESWWYEGFKPTR